MILQYFSQVYYLQEDLLQRAVRRVKTCPALRDDGSNPSFGTANYLPLLLALSRLNYASPSADFIAVTARVLFISGTYLPLHGQILSW